MKIFLTIPGFVPHGGTRVILEWANRLSAFHTVYLYSKDRKRPNWFRLSREVRIVPNESILKCCDTFILSSPHDIELLEDPRCPKNKFIFMQMLEHLFRPDDALWQDSCKKFYLAPYPLLSISKWNIEALKKMGRKSPIYYIGNGVNFADFPIYSGPKMGNVVLVEGWYPTNPTKDRDRIAPKVAARLKDMGCRILAYGQLSLDAEYRTIPFRYYRMPNLATLNTAYQQAAILLKASICDARSCSPMEAMTKGAVPIRAIEKGDDDLTDGYNSLRVPYEEEALFEAACKVLNNEELQNTLRQNGLVHVQKYSWDYWIGEIDSILRTAYQ